ncbi:MAG TPA: hypothetical protein VMV53_07955 [Acidimicrobiales bacterium]|nr:hypothetical protein [Acidimicrobiales bacterium]
MKVLQALSAVLLVGALAVVAGRSTSSLNASPLDAPCNAAVLTSSLTSIQSVASYGCDGHWAYVWANVNVASNVVSVTELLHYDEASGVWMAVPRSQYCDPSTLSAIVYHRACLSN